MPLRLGAGVAWGDLPALLDLVRAMRFCRRAGLIPLLFSTKLIILGVPLARCFGLKPVVTLTGMGRYGTSSRRFSHLAFRGALALALKSASATLLQKRSDYVAVANLPLRPNRLSFVGSAVVVERPRGAGRAAGARPIVFLAARLLRSKGVLDFLDVARSFSDQEVDFVLAGPDDPNERSTAVAVSEAARDGLITYLGRVDNKSVLENLATATVLLFPSHAEGMSRLLLEAAWVGCPVVAWDLPENTDALGRAGSRRVPVGDHRALSLAVGALIGDADRRRSIADAAATHVRDEMSIDRYIERLRGALNP